MDLISEAAVLSHELIALRRRLHAMPEVGLDLPATQAKVLCALEGLDLERHGRRAQFGDRVGADRFIPMPNPVAGSEDFSRVLAAVPGVFVFLGAAVGDPATAPSNHSPRAAFDDSVVSTGAALLAELAVRRLAT